MNLEDIVNIEFGLEQDQWSLSKPIFGKENQLEVVGWYGKSKSGNKYYILKCSTCSQDYELFGEGYFRALKGGLTGGVIPCGCPCVHRWTKDQYKVLCKRKAVEVGYEFIDFTEDEWEGKDTKIILMCKIHGEWKTGTISTLLNAGYGCPECGSISAKFAITKPDSEMIALFFRSKAFHPDTKFWRSDRKNSQGCKVYWFSNCPRCGEASETTCNELQQGCTSCACSPQKQKECYINFIILDEDVIAIKFGIAVYSKRRLTQQKSKCIYEIQQYKVYQFPSVESCKRAERECKQSMECGILSKSEMSDGYTETTSLDNLDNIIDIYERNGGVLIV